MSNQAVLIPVETLTTFIVEVLHTVGVPREDAKIVADCLLTSNLSGVESHGVVRLAHYVRRLRKGSIKARPDIQFEQIAPALGYLNGDDGLGHVVAYNAATRAMELAAETGTGAVSVGNSSHFGMAGFYTLRLAAEGYIGLCMTSTDRLLVPFGATKPFFGSNPICFGFPTDGVPVVLDMATTSIPYGKVALAAVEGKSIPNDWALDKEGNPTTDPKSAVGLYPASGPKGSGLAMVIDIFCSIVSGMPFGPHINQMYGDLESPRKLGHIVMAIDVRRFMPLETFKHNLGEMLNELNAQVPAAGFQKVYYPGQLEGERRDKRRAEGVPLDAGLFEELSELGRSMDIALTA
jgi:LDH2 family malate/lactate/ureidoglycolate dehydrogenase